MSNSYKSFILERRPRSFFLKTRQIDEPSTDLPTGWNCPRDYLIKYILECKSYKVWRTMENGDQVLVQNDQPKVKYDKLLVVNNSGDCKSTPKQARQFVWDHQAKDIMLDFIKQKRSDISE